MSRLFLRYQQSFQAMAFKYVRNAAVAEDIVADSFLKVIEQKDELPAVSNIPAYICSIIRNNSLNYLSTKSRQLQIEGEIHSTQQLILQDSIRSLEMCDLNKLFSQEIQTITTASLMKMPALTRKIFRDIRQLDKTYKEVAAENKISTRRVDYELQKAMNILRVALIDFLCLMIVFNHVIP